MLTLSVEIKPYRSRRGSSFSLLSPSSQGAGRFFLSHAVAFEGDTVGVVDDPVEDRVGDGGLADHVVPLATGLVKEPAGSTRRVFLA